MAKATHIKVYTRANYASTWWFEEHLDSKKMEILPQIDPVASNPSVAFVTKDGLWRTWKLSFASFSKIVRINKPLPKKVKASIEYQLDAMYRAHWDSLDSYVALLYTIRLLRRLFKGGRIKPFQKVVAVPCEMKMDFKFIETNKYCGSSERGKYKVIGAVPLFGKVYSKLGFIQTRRHDRTMFECVDEPLQAYVVHHENSGKYEVLFCGLSLGTTTKKERISDIVRNYVMDDLMQAHSGMKEELGRKCWSLRTADMAVEECLKLLDDAEKRTDRELYVRLSNMYPSIGLSFDDYKKMSLKALDRLVQYGEAYYKTYKGK